MHTVTKVFLAVAIVIVVVAGGFYAFESYAFNNPRTEITFYKSGEGTENVYIIPLFSLESRGLSGVSDEWDHRYFEILDVIGEMVDTAQSHQDHQPYFFDSDVRINGESTVFEIKGYYTEDGITKEYSCIRTLPYIVTENIAEH